MIITKEILLDNKELLVEIKKSIKKKYPSITDDKIMKCILTSINYDDDLPLSDFYRTIYEIVESELRNYKLNRILTEKILIFSDFNKLF